MYEVRRMTRIGDDDPSNKDGLRNGRLMIEAHKEKLSFNLT